MPTSRQAYIQQEHHQHDRDDAFPSSPPAYFDRRGSNPDAHQHAVFPAEPTSPRRRIRFRRIRFQVYASCYECGAAQQICTRWEEVRDGTRKFEWVDGGVCQYRGIVRDSVAAMMVAGPVEVEVEVEVVDGEVWGWMRAEVGSSGES